MLCSFQSEGSESKCPKHGTLRYRLCHGKLKHYNRINIDGPSRGNGRWSKSMGCAPKEIPEFERIFPGSSYHPETGDLFIKNRQHKKFEMKRRGWNELD